jgi:hypothetical protein
MTRFKVSVTWWGTPSEGVPQIAVETFSESGTRLSCVTFEPALRDSDIVLSAFRLAAECTGALPFP